MHGRERMRNWEKNLEQIQKLMWVTLRKMKKWENNLLIFRVSRAFYQYKICPLYSH